MIVLTRTLARSRVPLFFLGVATCSGCRDLSRFSSGGDHYEGEVVQGAFVRAGFDQTTRACLTLDANHLEDAPGALSTSDGRFARTPLRPIPQVWHDPLATLTFGEGRLKSVLAYLRPAAPGDGGAPSGSGGSDVMAVVSLMQTGDVEVRLVRGAPEVAAAAAASDGASTSGPSGQGENLFGIFPLVREEGPCSY